MAAIENLQETSAPKLVLPRLSTGRKKKWSYTSLAFSAFYFAPLFISDHFTTLQIIISVVCYVMFVALYLWTISTSRPAIGICLLSALITASIFVNPGGFALFGYPVFVAAYYFERKVAVISSFAIFALAVLMQLSFWQGPWIVFAQCTLVTAGLFGFGVMERKETIHGLREKRSNSEISQLSAIAERERIGRDLHDVAGHALSSISLKAQLAVKLLEKDRLEDAKAELASLAQLSQELLSEVRKTVSGMKQLSLSEQIDKLDNELSAKDLTLIKNIDASLLLNWQATQETHLALILKEAITNILRHSNADVLTLSFTKDKNNKHALLLIHDNGKVAGAPSNGNGMNGMFERVNILQGKMQVSSDNGFKIEISIPLPLHVGAASNVK